MNECKKVKFANEEAALFFIKKLKATSSRVKKPVSTYLCENCFSWHLTSWTEDAAKIEQLKKENADLMLKIKIKNRKIQMYQQYGQKRITAQQMQKLLFSACEQHRGLGGAIWFGIKWSGIVKLLAPVIKEQSEIWNNELKKYDNDIQELIKKL